MSKELMATMESAIISREAMVSTLTSEALAAHTRAIDSLMLSAKRSMFEIASRLLIIKNEKYYMADGFKDVFEYAEKFFGYKKNMVYKMVCTAEKFIDQTVDGESYMSILAHESEDYTVSQLIELNPLKVEEAEALNDNEVIIPAMTTKEIREVVKAYKSGEIDLEGNALADDSGEEGDDGDGDISEEQREENVSDEQHDELAMAIADILKNLEFLMSDTRVINDPMKVAKLSEFKSYLDGLEF